MQTSFQRHADLAELLCDRDTNPKAQNKSRNRALM